MTLGGIAEHGILAEQTQATIDKTQDLGNKAFETTNFGRTIMDYAKRLPKEAREALERMTKSPFEIRELLDPIKLFIVPIREANVEIARAEFYKKLPKALKRDQKKELFTLALVDYFKRLDEISKDAVKAYARVKGKLPELHGALRGGQYAADGLADIGIGTKIKNQRTFLERAGEDLSPTQRGDMLRAALQVGFIPAAVYGAAMAGRRRRGAGVEIETMNAAERGIMLNVLLQQTMLLADQTTRRVLDALKALETNKKNKAYQEEYDAAYSRLATLVGGKKIAERLLKLAKEGDAVATKAIMEQVKLSYNLHTGKASKVTPKRRTSS